MTTPTIDHLLTYPCELVRRTYPESPDEQGEQAATETVVAGVRCELQVAASREELGGAVQITTYRLFLPGGAPLRGWDAVRLESGETLELEGDAARSKSPLTGLAFVEATVRRTDQGEGEP